ncbi:MAG: hypothetical protein H0U53_03890 [Actinobacteria bacterium]|nr:hypothetical protein [Actinomycetota bacterium]
MHGTVERWGGPAAIAGGLLWMFAFVGFAFGEIAYEDATRPSPISEWIAGVALSLGAALIVVAMMSLKKALEERGGMPAKAGGWVALVGAVIALVPLWPMIFLGPFLVTFGLIALGVASLRTGVLRGGWSWLLTVGTIPALASGAAIEAAGGDGPFGTAVFGAVLGAGLVWLGTSMIGLRTEATGSQSVGGEDRRGSDESGEWQEVFPSHS